MSEISYSLDYTYTSTNSVLQGKLQRSKVVTEKAYRMGRQEFASPFPPSIHPVVSDLLHIAALVMRADRTCRRSRERGMVSYYPERGWRRNFEITVRVAEPDMWKRPPVVNALVEVFEWLTEDSWTFYFVKNEKFVYQPPLLKAPASSTPVVLFSGGLDSLAGVVELLQTTEDSVLLLSVVSSRLRNVLRGQVAELSAVFGAQRVQHVGLPFQLVHSAEDRKIKEEKSQGSRGFLYFAVGVAQAVIYNTDRIIVCENGIGMLNLPFNKRPLGTQLTRAVHPHTIVLLSRLLELLELPRAIRYEAPFLSKTKGELCRSLKRQRDLGYLCSLTSSCDGFPFREKRPAAGTEIHCGVCSSCLLRRQAVMAAQLRENDASVHYKHDIFRQGVPAKELQCEPLLMMYDQATTFRSLSEHADRATEELFCQFPELYRVQKAVEQLAPQFHIGSQQDAGVVLTQLLRKYSDEWEEFSGCLSLYG